MINDLKYAVTFPTNGVSLAGEISFQPGSTAITGDNGAGKSFVAEMIRYGLFGKRALRGPASDYKSLDMQLCFRLAEHDYVVKRGKKEELVWYDGQLAVGADAVNKKIVELLGFDLEVFDVVCAANQKESERLTRLTPAKRKELIDDVVGLTRQEAVEKACREEAKLARVEAEGMARALVLPEEPVKPEGYRSSADILVELNNAKDLEETRRQLQAVIAAVPPEPVKPAEPVGDLTGLEAHEKARIEAEARYKALYSSIARIPDAVHTREELEAAAALLAYDQEVKRRGPQPDLPLADVEKMLADWATIEAMDKYIGLTMVCPHCGNDFDADHDVPDNPAWTKKSLEAQRRYLEAWAEPLVEPAGVRLTQAEIVEGMKALDRAADKAALQTELDALPVLEIKVNQLAAARVRERQWAVYAGQLDHYAACAAEAGNAQYELDRLPAPAHTVAELDAAFVAAKVYETQLANFTEQKERFDELSKEIAEKQERAEAFAAGAKGLVEARRTLKAFLAPSLSRVASKIIQQMTVNALRPLSHIDVDEDMNITADGQDCSTFNGAHATMINLALRLALGQVLVARVLPLFIGDEIDSDATPANAQAIADGLMACKEQLKQIVLISHKRLEGVDHEVML